MEFWQLLWNNIVNTSWVEWIAVLSLTAYVILATRQIPLAWPVSMVGVSLYFIIALEAKLYAELPLQVFYFFISLYGFYSWKYGGQQHTELPVTYSTGKLITLLLIIGIIGTLVMGYLLDSHTDTDVPYWDAGTTTFSLIGTWMQARKKIGNWIVWLAVDMVYVGLFYYKGYILMSMLNILYLFFATYGLIAWYRSMKTQTQTAS